jgi:hypothetical protein
MHFLLINATEVSEKVQVERSATLLLPKPFVSSKMQHTALCASSTAVAYQRNLVNVSDFNLLEINILKNFSHQTTARSFTNAG